jgi:hypothetical protein
MAASSKLMIGEAERRFPVRIKMALPPGGFGTKLTEIHAWLDENCGANGWAMTPSGLRGIVNDAVAIYFLDPATAIGFVARWCAGAKVETVDGVLRLREDAPAPRVGLKPHGMS